jgi:hypothetical protein
VLFIGSGVLGEAWALETEAGRAEIEYSQAASGEEALALFNSQLCGTIVS